MKKEKKFQLKQMISSIFYFTSGFKSEVFYQFLKMLIDCFFLSFEAKNTPYPVRLREGVSTQKLN